VGHEFIDHTSEITLRVDAPTFPGLVEEATAGLGTLVPTALRGSATAGSRHFLIEGTDRTAALVDWLNEIVYLCEAEQWLPVDPSVRETDGGGLSVRTRGVDLTEPWVAVKAATLHRAVVEEGPEGWSAEVTLDV